MNFLFIKPIGSYIDIPWALTELGHTVSFSTVTNVDPVHPVAGEYLPLKDELMSGNYDFVISYLFLPGASDICQEYQMPYISWTYDSPLMSFYHPALENSCNYTFLFDKHEADYLKSKGMPHIYYLPLAVNTSRVGALEISAEDEKLLSCDISFVGNLYQDNTYNQLIQALPSSLQFELKSYLMSNLCKWDVPKKWPVLSNELTNLLIEEAHADSWNPFNMPDNMYLGILILSRKLAEMDRLTVLNTLSEHHVVDMYTKSTSDFLGNIHVHPPVEYATTMNKIFYLSKINLNITLPSIVSGVPLRILDIMGCGGFVLTNYQEGIEDMFEIGTDLDVYHNLSELLDKVNFYLSHERERLTIAMNGYKKVCSMHNYQKRMEQIIQIVTEGTE